MTPGSIGWVLTIIGIAKEALELIDKATREGKPEPSRDEIIGALRERHADNQEFLAELDKLKPNG